MKHIDDLAGQMRAEEDRLFAERTTNADRSQTLAASMTSVGSGFVIVLAGISIFLVRRSSRARDEAEAKAARQSISTSRPRSTSVPRTCAKPMTRSSASPTCA